MDEQTLLNFERICCSIRNNTPARYKWQWDERFHVALIAFDKEDMETIFSAVIGGFMEQWDVKTIAKASKSVRRIVKDIFDIKPGQIIFAADESVHSVLLGAWWPWADGTIISLRIGMFPAGKDALDPEESKNALVRWFGIEL